MYSRTQAFKNMIVLLIIPALLMLASCKDENGNKQAGGQTIVVVNGDDITVHQLNIALAKLKLQTNLNEQQFNQIKAKIVDSLILRQLFVQQALEKDMDRRPRYLQSVEEAKKEILMQLFLEKQLKSLSAVTDTDISQFYQQRPELFLDRKIYKVLEIVTDNSTPSKKIKRQIESYSEMSALSIELPQWFKDNDIKYQIKPWIKASEKIQNNVLLAIYPSSIGDVVLTEQGKGYRFLKVLDVSSKKVSEQKAATLIKLYINKQNKSRKIKENAQRLKKQANINWGESYSELKDISFQMDSRNEPTSLTEVPATGL